MGHLDILMKTGTVLAKPLELFFSFKYLKNGEGYTEKVVKTVTDSKGVIKISAPEPGFHAVEMSCCCYPLIFSQFVLNECSASEEERNSGYFIFDKPVVFACDKKDVSEITFEYSLVAVSPECNSSGTVNELQKRAEQLERDNQSYRAAIDNCTKLASELSLGKRARAMKLLTTLLHPEVAGEKSAFAVLFKKFILRKKLIDSWNIYTDVISPLAACKKADLSGFQQYRRKSDFAGTVYIFASVPFDDIGGGQRSAQLTRCSLQRMYRVVYIYKYPKVEQGVEIANESISAQFEHLYFNNVSSNEIFKNAPENSTVIFEFPHPDYVPFLREADRRSLYTVYELIDPWETSLGANWYSRATEDIFINTASKVVATAKVLHKKLVDAGRSDAVYSPNAADFRYFSKYASRNVPADFPKVYKKNIIYFGSMYGEWFDWGALKTAAMSNADTGFLMIGDPPADRSNMPQNILFLGMKQNSQLSDYLCASDAAIIPFTPGPLVDAVSPIKVFEYLFPGKPVITLDMKEITGYPGVYQAKDSNEFAELCSLKTVVPPDGLEHDLFISSNNWNQRVDEICRKLQLKHTYSIIILIHNNEKIIERTLTTLLKHVSGLPVEIIVVDNKSSDKGPEIVRTRFADSVTLLENPENGCSSGRNLGAAHAKNEVLIFFDSDQWFSSSAWLYDYDLLSELHPEVGAFSWNAGWFAGKELTGPIVEYIPGRATDDMLYQANGFRTDIHYLATSGFFIRKSLFDEIGGLDTAYDPTIFEDTDLSMRVLNAGYRIAYRDFAGIMHQPHQTTQADLNSSVYRNLFDRNSTYFKKTWGEMLKSQYGIDVEN